MSETTQEQEQWDFYRDGVTQSMIQTFLTCPEKHRLKNHEMLSGMWSRDALNIGSIVHEVLDTIYTTHKTDPHTWQTAMQASHLLVKEMEAMEFEQGEKSGADARAFEKISENHGIASAMLNFYFMQWPQDFKDCQWVILEEQFDIPFCLPSGHSTRLRGKIDGVFRDKTGKLWLFETKTKARIEDEAIADKLRFELQVCMYAMVVSKLLGEQPVGLVYNLIRRPSLRRGVSETLDAFLARNHGDIEKRQPHYYMRYQSPISKQDVERWAGEFLHIIDLMERHNNGEFNYRNPTACTERYGACEFLKLCGNGDTYGLQKRELVFPELQPKYSLTVTA